MLRSTRQFHKNPFFFFCGGRGLTSGSCIYYVLSLPTELSSRGQFHQNLK